MVSRTFTLKMAQAEAMNGPLLAHVFQGRGRGKKEGASQMSTLEMVL
jgi:hypothetical protein